MAAHKFTRGFRVKRAAFVIDIESIRLDPGGDDFRTEFLENERSDEIGGPMPAIHHHFDSVKRDIVGGVFREFNVAPAGVIDTVSLANLTYRKWSVLGFPAKNVALDGFLQIVGKLVSVRPENLDPVVFVRIMGRGDHHPGGGTHRLGEVGHCGSGHRTDHEHIHAHRDESAGECGLQHVSGNPGVFAHENTVPIRTRRAQHPRNRLAHVEGDFRGHRKLVHAPADAVSAK